MKWTLAYVIDLVVLCIMSSMMYLLGYSFTSYQWWIAVLCMIVAFICGGEHERKSNLEKK